MPDPAPAAPASTPAAPAASTPPPAAIPPSGPDPRPPEPSMFDEIDALAAQPPPAKEAGKPAPPPPSPSRTPAPAKAAAVPPPSTGTTPPASAPAGQTPSAPPATLDDKGPAKIDELRTAYGQRVSELKAARAEITTLKAAKPADDPEKKTIVEQNQKHQARIKELEEELKFTSFEKTDEYKKEYWAPFQESYDRGRALASSLKVAVEDGSQRQGTAKDFETIMLIGDESEAIAKAKELFGDGAPAVLYHRERVKETNARRAKSIDDYQEKGAERQKQKTEQTLADQQSAETKRTQRTERLLALNKATIEARKETMAADETDEVGKKILSAEEAMVNLFFGILTPEQEADLPEKVRAKLVDGRLPDDEVVKLHSAMWTKARGYGFLLRKYNQTSARVKELEKELEAFQGSVPGVGGVRRTPGDPGVLDVNAEIDAMAT